MSITNAVTISPESTKKERAIDYIKSIYALDQAIEPYQSQKKELRKSYVSNGWLDAEEIKSAMRVYRILKIDADFEQLADFYEATKGNVTEEDE